MNLSAYDAIPEFINKNRTWTDISTKRIISNEIKYRKYYCLAKRYDINLKTDLYFLILLDNPPTDRKYYSTIIKNCRLNFKFKDIWEKTILSTITKNINIIITHIESTDDGDIYQLDI